MIGVTEAVADEGNSCFHACLAYILGCLSAVIAADNCINTGVDVIFNETNVFAGCVVGGCDSVVAVTFCATLFTAFCSGDIVFVCHINKHNTNVIRVSTCVLRGINYELVKRSK